MGFDLQLSGHTHGGQIVLSAPWDKRWHVASVLGAPARDTQGRPYQLPPALI
jgi:hypothetical protein